MGMGCPSDLSEDAKKLVDTVVDLKYTTDEVMKLAKKVEPYLGYELFHEIWTSIREEMDSMLSKDLQKDLDAQIEEDGYLFTDR